MEGTVKCAANYVPLSPISFLDRSAILFADKVSVVNGDLDFTWAETRERCVKLASALQQLGISRHDVVAAMIPNIPEMFELHFGVPMAGAVLCTLNIRHDSAMVSSTLNHSDAKLVFVHYQLLNVVTGALKILSEYSSNKKLPQIVVINSLTHHLNGDSESGVESRLLEYNSLLASGRPDFEIIRPLDELEPISLNYTSGTTSNPKGVIYSHRGAYLNSLAAVLLTEMKSMPVYLWTVPMFHCNGWCLTWAVTAQGGKNVFLQDGVVTGKEIFECIEKQRVTHMAGAPTILNLMVNTPETDRRPVPRKVSVMTGGAPPPPQVLFKMEELGFDVTHAYGLTETYGAATICAWKPEWNTLAPDARAKLKSRQGLQHLGMEEADVKDPATMKSVPGDGKTMGEVMFRGNTIMSGYLKNPEATENAFKDGWFRTGDLAVKHPDGYIELKDRLKDIIMCGGESISTIEVESVIYSHPAVLEAAVIGKPDDYWGETPCAFVKLKNNDDDDTVVISDAEIIQHCCDHLPAYMAPTTVVFADLPKTSTGKIQKFLLRQKAKDLSQPS
ncbi:OLC1v1005587C1 [Oldenlandia corymbosa var. corymbosa]|uniref:OLC1v1005587C1 n=1 Tax=Oldenlandia corymbosa var. corymbosa TaxID=529605 RepID=A0AAV1DHE6_OLDCO|nr:OLC1v1005587C1 [Oldenlandia corymbosa var. corymbosa]